MTYEERKARLHEIRTAGIGGRKRFDIDDVCFLSGEVSRLEAELERVEAERDAAILKRDDAQHFLDLMGPQLVAARAEAEALRKKLNEVDEDAVRELDTLRAEAEALRRKLEVQNEYESERNKGLWSKSPN